MGVCPGEHLLFNICLHTSVKNAILTGLVATFTSVRPFPQADEHTSQRNVKIPVNSRSYGE